MMAGGMEEQRRRSRGEGDLGIYTEAVVAMGEEKKKRRRRGRRD
jgi:hypothetical protein